METLTQRMSITEAMEQLFDRQERGIPRWLAHDWLVFVGFLPPEAASILSAMNYEI